MNIADIVVSLLLLATLSLAVGKIIRDKRAGKACSGCSGCPVKGSCESAK